MHTLQKHTFTDLRPHLLLVLTTLIWAGNAVAGKFAIGHVSPMVLTFLRWAIAFVIVAAFAWKPIRNDWPTIRRRFGYLLVMGHAWIYRGSTSCSIRRCITPRPINVAIEQSAIPLIIFIGNLIIYRITFGWRHIVGFVLTLIGVVVVVSAGDPAKLTTGGFNRGDVMMLFAGIFYSLYSIALRGKPKLHWLSLLAALFAGALLSSAIAMIWEIRAGDAIFPTTTTGLAGNGLHRPVCLDHCPGLLYRRRQPAPAPTPPASISTSCRCLPPCLPFCC